MSICLSGPTLAPQKLGPLLLKCPVSLSSLMFLERAVPDEMLQAITMETALGISSTRALASSPAWCPTPIPTFLLHDLLHDFCQVLKGEGRGLGSFRSHSSDLLGRERDWGRDGCAGGRLLG